jgi:N-acetylglucosamine-6-phosphate deacetylase
VTEVVFSGGAVLRDGAWDEGDLVCRDGLIVDGTPIGGAGSTTIDATGLYVAPGFVDLQCNGGLGLDLTRDPAALWELGAALPQWGVTAWLPTIVTAPEGAIDAALAALAAGPPPGWHGAEPLGLHLEGPFLAEPTRGAHRREHLRAPSTAAVDGWSRDAGVALVTLAPELAGADEVIRELVARDVVVSLGHSGATADEARWAIDAGATWVTHLFNAMGPFHHRAPGLAGVALADDRVHVGLIADGAHVAPEAVAVAQRTLGRRLTLVTDAAPAMGTAGAADASRLADGTLAGGVAGMDRMVRNLVAFSGCPRQESLLAASAAPAEVLRDRSRGRLEPGRRGDVVLLSPDLLVRAAWIGGTPVNQAGTGSVQRVTGS